MELVINRVKYKCEFDDVNIIVSSDSNALAFSHKWNYFIEKFDCKEAMLEWAEKEEISGEAYISYEFNKEEQTRYLVLPLIQSFEWKYTWYQIGRGLINQECFVDFNPIGVSLSAYRKIKNYDDTWELFQRIDFDLNYNNQKKLGKAIFNFGSKETLVSRDEMHILKEYRNVKIITERNRITKSKFSDRTKGRLIANRELLDKYQIKFEWSSINYSKRYNELLSFFNEYLKAKYFDGLEFISTGFDSVKPQKVSFKRNRMVFKDENTDINPITGMRNYGVYQPAPNASDTKFIFIFQNNDDANTLYKYLKNGYKGFPGLERYVDIPLVLADANSDEQQYKQLQYGSLENLINQYHEFESKELSGDYYENYFAIVIGDFDKDEPEQAYYDLKLALLSKGIPSQFINHKNIRKSSVFNYHLPNIAIGIHAKLGGVPWRIDSQKRNELVIGFNQDFNKEKERFLAGSVFFDNHGKLRRTFSFPEKESSNEIINELKKAVNGFLEENGEIERIVIHYHKSLSKKEKSSIDKLLKEEFQISVPFAVVEVNDTKSRLELAFDPEYSFQMPISGSIVRLTKKGYLLFNNNRFKAVAPITVKDELPLKIKIHFADESGFSHKELIEQVYEFSRLIWKGLKQRSQPATCFYAREIAKFKAHANQPIPENKITQTTPWVI